jgi:hypothetical protein
MATNGNDAGSTGGGNTRNRSARRHQRANGGGAAIEEPSFAQRLMEGVTPEQGAQTPSGEAGASSGFNATPNKKVRTRQEKLRRARNQVSA